MRWTHPQLGAVEPAEFIPIAESTGLIVPLGRWAIDEICRQTAAWRALLPDPFRLAVNVSARQLLSPLEDVLAEAMRRRACDPERLEIELTETALVAASATIDDRLRRIVEMGIGVTLDDFGTGYSSLSLLKRFPISKVKIDRDFVHGLPSEPGDVAISLAIIGMAKSLGLTVVAEGVEDEAQHEFLALRGCDALQGWLFGPPVPADEFARRWLRSDPRSPGRVPLGPRSGRAIDVDSA